MIWLLLTLTFATFSLIMALVTAAANKRLRSENDRLERLNANNYTCHKRTIKLLSMRLNSTCAIYRCFRCGRLIAKGKENWFNNKPYCTAHYHAARAEK